MKFYVYSKFSIFEYVFSTQIKRNKNLLISFCTFCFKIDLAKFLIVGFNDRIETAVF